MTTSASNPPSVDFKDMLVAGLSLVFETNLFISSLPDTPNDCVCVYDSGGGLQLDFGSESPKVQILVRNLDYVTGYALARDIKYYLNISRNNEVRNGTRYISILIVSDILSIGQDEENRYMFSINFQILRSGI